MRAEILSYSRSRGLFAGVTINGSSVAEDKDANEKFYGTPYTSQEVVTGKISSTPAAVKTLADALSRNVPARRAGN
jgi:lipid-binding SYLF domain-containing protein